MSEDAATPLIDRLRAHLAGRCAVIVLDNCEHVTDAAANVADALASSCARLKIVAIRHSPFAIRRSPFAIRHSPCARRWALGVAGEQIVPSRPLSLPLAPGLTAMQASEAVRLFIDRASLAQLDFAIDAHNALAVVAICHRPDGIALYIELAAARASMLLVAKISARLSDSFRFPTGCRRAVPRHQTLQAALDWSHDTLPVAEQRLFRRLAVFAGRLHSGRRHRGCRCWRQVHGAAATC